MPNRLGILANLFHGSNELLGGLNRGEEPGNENFFAVGDATAAPYERLPRWKIIIRDRQAADPPGSTGVPPVLH
jgi:hypothetical protein